MAIFSEDSLLDFYKYGNGNIEQYALKRQQYLEVPTYVVIFFDGTHEINRSLSYG